MRPEDTEKLAAAVSKLGEQTKAAVVIEMTHDGKIHLNPAGDLLDISFMSQNLHWLVMELLAGRLK